MIDHFFLNVYIICPAVLAVERAAVEAALAELRCDGNRFRGLSSLPDEPSEKRREAIGLSDAVIVLCGTSYGKTIKDEHHSIRQDYFHAVNMNKRIAVFLTGSADADPDVQRFMAEIDLNHIRARSPVQTAHDLGAEVKQAMTAAFSNCFRQVNDKPGRNPFDGDIGLAEKALSENPESDANWRAAAVTYAGAQGIDDVRAIDFWKRYTGRFSESGEGWAQLGFCYLRINGIDKNLHEQPLHALLAAIEHGFKDDGLINDRIGHIYLDKRAPDEAEKYFREAAQKTPSRFGCCYGGCLMALKKYDQALPFMRDAAEKYQRDSRCCFQAGVCHSELNDTEAAIEAYKKSIDLNPSCANAWFNLGGLYWNHDRVDDAKKTWAVCLEKFPDNPMCEPARYFMSNG